MMGIGTDDTWVLSPTVRDKSRLRNYLAYNIAGQIEPTTPDLRYCEVLFAQDGGYYYGGLYMMCESVKVSPERVNIQKDASGYHVGNGYLILRDRYSDDKIILDTWGTRKGYNTHIDISKGKTQVTVFSLEYPKNGAATYEVTSIFSTGANGRDILHKHGFKNGWRDCAKKELQTNVYCVGEIYLICVFSLFLLNDYGSGNLFTKVVHSKLCKDFLVHELHLFCVQMQQTEWMLQGTERGFNSPAHGIKPFNISQRK